MEDIDAEIAVANAFLVALGFVDATEHNIARTADLLEILACGVELLSPQDKVAALDAQQFHRQLRGMSERFAKVAGS
jgi:hypothetical protein